mmetsp:Transcript_10684/g.44182  ORF Transcript_10684/g.44182 Transcript_10684/m.44182 type:complete len:212 (-) Transcript_10684:1425-2060(-)
MPASVRPSVGVCQSSAVAASFGRPRRGAVALERAWVEPVAVDDGREAAIIRARQLAATCSGPRDRALFAKARQHIHHASRATLVKRRLKACRGSRVLVALDEIEVARLGDYLVAPEHCQCARAERVAGNPGRMVAASQRTREYERRCGSVSTILKHACVVSTISGSCVTHVLRPARDHARTVEATRHGLEVGAIPAASRQHRRNRPRLDPL